VLHRSIRKEALVVMFHFSSFPFFLFYFFIFSVATALLSLHLGQEDEQSAGQCVRLEHKTLRCAQIFIVNDAS